MRNTILIAAIGSLTMLATAMPASARINERQQNQQQRIGNGIAKGKLTPREAVRLEKQQSHIARYEQRSRADGRGLTKVERARLEHMQDRASKNIYRQKHDRQGR